MSVLQRDASGFDSHGVQRSSSLSCPGLTPPAGHIICLAPPPPPLPPQPGCLSAVCTSEDGGACEDGVARSLESHGEFPPGRFGADLSLSDKEVGSN